MSLRPLIDAVGWTMALTTLPGSFELSLLTLGGVLPRRRAPAPPEGRPLRLAVVVPAHDEQEMIGQTVLSLLSCARDGVDLCVAVVADNCTDQTAARAADAGARVLVRADAERRGKGYALDFAFRTLTPEKWEAFVVVDADSLVAPDFLTVLRGEFASGAEAVQVWYRVLNAADSVRTRLMNAALLAFNLLRPRGRDRWGLSAGILGNGFGVTAETLAGVPYTASSIVEDLEYHLRLVRSGRRVRFTDRTCVMGYMPAGGKAVGTQRARWEGGRFLMIREHAAGLAVEVLGGRWRLAEPLLELLLLPLSFHVTLLLLAAAWPCPSARAVAAAGLAMVGVHVAAALAVGGAGAADVAALLAAPFYIVWKLAISRAIVAATSGKAQWVRTERGAGEKGGKS